MRFFTFLMGIQGKSIVPRSTADIFKVFISCRHCGIEFKMFQAVNAKSLPIYFCK
jgi:hypothetical protein